VRSTQLVNQRYVGAVNWPVGEQPTTRLRLALKLRMSGVIPLFHPCAFTAWTETNFIFTLKCNADFIVKIFGLKRDDVRRKRTGPFNEGRHNLYSLPDITWVIREDG
jgi:hypothetical protein